MTQAKLKKITKGWQEILELRHWNVKLDFIQPPAPGADATVNTSDDYRDARIRMAGTWRTWSDWFANYTIAHELVHVSMRDVDYAFTRATESIDVEGTVHVHLDWYDHAREGFVDQLAEVLVNRLGVIT